MCQCQSHQPQFASTIGNSATDNRPTYILESPQALNRNFGTPSTGDGARGLRARKTFRHRQRPTPFSPWSSAILDEQQYETRDTSACEPFTLVAVENPGGGRIKDKQIPSSSDIVTIQGAFSKTRLHRLAAEALKALVCAARADGIKHPQLLPTGSLSGFRSPKQQASLRKRSESIHGSKDLGTWVAKPGSSAHQSGRAIDFYLGLANDRRNVTKLRQTSAYKWLAANGKRFGFYPYPKEPWHWEYNPPASSQREIFPELEDEGENFAYEAAFADETAYETGRKCKRDWCAPTYIQWVQRSLNLLIKAGKRLREDGFHDDNTRRAIISFQKQQGLKPDGEVGPITEKTLISKGASQPPPAKQLPCSPTKPETLIAKLNQYRGSIPLHILLGWVEVESGRQIGSLTSLCERGYFQIYPGEAKDRQIANHHLLSYDEDHSLQSGIKLVNYFIARTNLLVKQYGLPNQGDVYWKVVKLHHWIPSGPEKILADMQANGIKPSSWAAITSHALDPRNRGRLTAKIKRDPQQGIQNADKMLDKANGWLKKLTANPALNKEAEYFEDEYQAFEFNQELGSSAPALLKCEKTSVGETLCVNISLDLTTAPNSINLNTGRPAANATFYKVEPMTGIFIPQTFVPQTKVDLVLYLHGHKTASPGSSASIGEYWNGSKFPYFALREEVNNSGQNVIFVAPTLGPLSQAGNLTTAKGFDNYITKVLAALNQHLAAKNQRPVIEVGRIILAAHSGGGSPMLRIAELTGSSNASKVVECWGFDSVYGSVESRWVNWAAAHPTARLFFYSQDTAGRSKTLESLGKKRKLQNICVHIWKGEDFTAWAKSQPPLKKSTVGPHFWVPIVYLKERLQNLPCRVAQPRPAPRVKSRRLSGRSELEVSRWDNPALPQTIGRVIRNPNAQALAAFTAPTTQATVANAIAIVKLICAYHGIPWRVAYTLLEHEGGVRLFTHQDGVMQTIQGARTANIPRIPRLLKLALLGLPQTDTTADSALVTALHSEFPRRLAVQIATGIQELISNLEKFNGYVALAYQAYNAGAGWAYYTATRGAKKAKPAGVTAAEWENMCKLGAALLHQSASAVRIGTGVWQCDKNIPTWFSHIAVNDAQSGLQLIAYKYLRSITESIHKQRPTTPCNQAHHKERQPGSGPIIQRQTRDGSLDKLYQPSKLARTYYQIAQTQLTSITDDGLPLKVELGQLVKMPLTTVSNPIPIP